MATIVEETAAPPDRGIRHFVAKQTPQSWLTLGLGVTTLLMITLGTTLVLNHFGWTQTCPEGVSQLVCSRSEPLTVGFTSDALGTVITLTGVLSVLTLAAFVWSYLTFTSKPAKEATIAGLVLAIQAATIGLLLWWFRGSEVERFVRNFFDFAVLGDFFSRFVTGAKNTLILSLAGGALGFFLGLVLALFTMSKRAVIRAPARIYINFFRGTPLIWQLSFAGLGVVTAMRLDFFSGSDGPYRVAIAVLGLNLAAYSAEVYRSGIQSLERGQIEAARSLGLSYMQSMRYVIVPQAIRRVIPPLTNEFVILIKDTSLVIVLGLAFHQKELLGVGRDIYQSTFNATAWLGSAAGFLVITLPMIRIVTIMEKRMRSGLTSVIG